MVTFFRAIGLFVYFYISSFFLMFFIRDFVVSFVGPKFMELFLLVGVAVVPLGLISIIYSFFKNTLTSSFEYSFNEVESVSTSLVSVNDSLRARGVNLEIRKLLSSEMAGYGDVVDRLFLSAKSERVFYLSDSDIDPSQVNDSLVKDQEKHIGVLVKIARSSKISPLRIGLSFFNVILRWVPLILSFIIPYHYIEKEEEHKGRATGGDFFVGIILFALLSYISRRLTDFADNLTIRTQLSYFNERLSI